ncbi:MAG: helix-turn-helix transcriptional regulator [Proteobacteria bacterium]|jgi:transcriptional regulator with XRE-family HTH domain|nr:helix-turn-helix transcriptional regulator [Pseudomonadota bacterium]
MVSDFGSDNSFWSNRLGLFLKNKREAQGLTQSDVAKRLGYGSPQFISNIERGISSVPLKSLKTLVEMYGVSPEEIIDVFLEEKKSQLLKALRGQELHQDHARRREGRVFVAEGNNS